MNTSHKQLFSATLRTFVVVFSLVFCTLSLYSQHGQRNIDPQKHEKKTMEALQERLDLSEEQQKSLQPIIAQHFAELQVLHQKTQDKFNSEERRKAREEFRALREERKTIHKQTVEKAKGVLTEEQISSLESFFNERKSRQRRRMRNQNNR